MFEEIEESKEEEEEEEADTQVVCQVLCAWIGITNCNTHELVYVSIINLCCVFHDFCIYEALEYTLKYRIPALYHLLCMVWVQCNCISFFVVVVGHHKEVLLTETLAVYQLPF